MFGPAAGRSAADGADVGRGQSSGHRSGSRCSASSQMPSPHGEVVSCLPDAGDGVGSAAEGSLGVGDAFSRRHPASSAPPATVDNRRKSRRLSLARSIATLPSTGYHLWGSPCCLWCFPTHTCRPLPGPDRLHSPVDVGPSQSAEGALPCSWLRAHHTASSVCRGYLARIPCLSRPLSDGPFKCQGLARLACSATSRMESPPSLG
jgi:hypothetical protein